MNLPINRGDDMITARMMIDYVIGTETPTHADICYISDLNARMKSVSLSMLTRDNYCLYTEILGKLTMIITVFNEVFLIGV